MADNIDAALVFDIIAGGALAFAAGLIWRLIAIGPRPAR
jgi:hypothetical protein